MKSPDEIAAEQWLESSQLRLKAARILIENQRCADSLTRVYFAVYHAACALLLVHDLHAKTHSGVHTMLGMNFRDKLDTRLAHQLWQEREDCDYRLMEPSSAHVRSRLQEAKRFIEEVQAIL